MEPFLRVSELQRIIEIVEQCLIRLLKPMLGRPCRSSKPQNLNYTASYSFTPASVLTNASLQRNACSTSKRAWMDSTIIATSQIVKSLKPLGAHTNAFLKDLQRIPFAYRDTTAVPQMGSTNNGKQPSRISEKPQLKRPQPIRWKHFKHCLNLMNSSVLPAI